MPDVVVGFLTGIVSGLGIGGGSVLMMYLSLTGYDHFRAAGINLTYFVACAVPVVIKHIKEKFISLHEILPVAIPACVMSVAVTLIVCNFDESLLRRAFGFFAIATGIRELLKKNK